MGALCSSEAWANRCGKIAGPEKLRYMHRNPVKRGLVGSPEQWRWSSFRSYMFGEPGMVGVNRQDWELKIKPCPAQNFHDGAEVGNVSPGA